ncbi:MAG: NAD(P)-binding domain-containing protein [Actinomycetota bacterium]
MSVPTTEPVLDVGVIGAGPSGLVLAKQLADTGATFTVFERHRDVGGIWDIDAPGSPMYESAHFISSKTLSGFAGFPMPDDYPHYPSHRQILAYIRSFAEAYDLRRHVEFDNGVDQAKTDADGLWVLQMADGSERRCRYLVCANGVTWEPNEVTWPGQETFTGEIRHSVTYRDAAEFAGKRVLVVGAGNSGVDIACDASFAADRAFLSVRRGYHFIPKFIGSTPLDVFAHDGPKLPKFVEKRFFRYLLRAITGDLTKYGLPKPDHDILESHPLMNTQILHYLGHGDCIAKRDVERFDGDHVLFTDGSREQIDLVIAATGYHHKSAFLAEDVFEMKDGRPDLYLRMLPRNHDNLAVLGFIEFASAAYENFDRMARVIVADATAASDSPRRRDVRRRRRHHFPDLAGSHTYVKSARHANYVDVETFHEVLDAVTSDITALDG